MVEKAVPAKRSPGRPAKPKELPAEAKSEIDELKAQLAAMQAQLAVQASLNEGTAPATTLAAMMTPKFDQTGTRVVIHFVEDGFTFSGQIWYRGQEIEFVVGSPAWEASVRRGNWVPLAFDEQAQILRYGRVMFKPGPWPGLGYDAAEYEKGKKIDPATAQQAADKEAKRHRNVPEPRLSE